MAYLRQLENKVLGNLKQTAEKDIVEWMGGGWKYVKEEVRGVKFVVENERSKKTQRRIWKEFYRRIGGGKGGKWGKEESEAMEERIMKLVIKGVVMSR